MKLKKVFGLFIIGFALMCSPAMAAQKAPAEAPPSPDPAKMLKQMCDYLKSHKSFTFRAEVTDDRVYNGGKKLQYAFDLDGYVRRPDKLRIRAEGDLESKDFYYDGKTITLYEKLYNVYAVTPASGDIDKALDKAVKDYGLRVALADLTYNGAYELMSKNLTSSLYVGPGRVRGVQCHHLAFDRPDIQFQVWIEAGDRPLLRKLLITQKTLPDSPQWTAYITD
ncbi:MAG: DUF2092 domain-containing protein [Syntrophobacteraceae bacterium]|jgi:hypothetical protein